VGVKLGFLASREEQRLRVLKNRVFRKIFVSKWEEVTRNWRKMHINELHELYSSPNITWVVEERRIMCWVGHVASGWEKTRANRVLVR
jgi:hypothetical protein